MRCQSSNWIVCECCNVACLVGKFSWYLKWESGAKGKSQCGYIFSYWNSSSNLKVWRNTVQIHRLWIATFGEQRDALTSIVIYFQNWVRTYDWIFQSSQMFCQSIIGKARAEQSWLWPDLVSMSPGASRTPRISPFLTPVVAGAPFKKGATQWGQGGMSPIKRKGQALNGAGRLGRPPNVS